MKVLQVVTSLQTGGAEMVAVELAKHSLEYGHTTAVLSLIDGDGLPKQRADEYGISTFTLNSRLFSLQSIREFKRVVSDYDVVHLHLWQSLYLAVLARLQQPILFTEHSTHNRRQNYRWARPFERLAYAKAQTIIGCGVDVSEKLSGYLASMGTPREVVTIENGASERFFGPAEVRRKADGEALRLVSIGSLNETKNNIHAIRTIANLPDVTLDIFGDGPLRSELQAYLDDNSVTNVALKGRTAEPEKALDDYHAFLSSSLFEGSPLALLEARARGLGIVGPSVPGVKQYINDGVDGLLYELDNPENSLAGSIRRLQQNGSVEQFSRASLVMRDKLRMASAYASYNTYYRKAIDVISNRG